MSTRFRTSYPGVFYREAKRIGRRGKERVYYVIFKKDGKFYEEKVGRQYTDDMSPARANSIRAARIEGSRPSRKEIREQERRRKAEEEGRWTIDRLWHEYKAGKEPTSNLYIDQKRYEKHIKPIFGDKEPKDLIVLDVDRLRIGLSKTQKPQTVKHVLALLKRIINFGVRKHLCDGIRFSIEMPKVSNLKTEDLDQDQLANLLRVVEKDPHPQAGPIMKAALFTGMRRSELFKLKWDDIDFRRRFIHIRDPKGGPDEKIPLNDAAKSLFESYPRSESPYVFPGIDGKQRTNINQAVNRIKKEAGLPRDFRPLHGLRHVYASVLASSGQVDMYTLQKLLTHKSPQMTQRYAHLRDETLRKAADLAADLIGSAVSEKGKVIRLDDEKD